eukprot:TRINITY_DN39840_c0_g1_i1.p1 TRINITY_DN39840_c0_g1~~TRINITY_DN39840_c0_g1_i1.p1  ORF type:complete len:322 (+),score=53.98 TRINITY_DN39840_c0_g1_i1:78-968(+)
MDLPRTAGKEPMLQASIGRIRALVLRHMAEDPELGYCQGLTFVAAAFAAASGSQIEAYSRFKAFLQRVRGLWLPGFPLLEKASSTLEVLAVQRPWYKHLTNHEVSMGMFLPQAMLTMFVSWLPLETLLQCISLLELNGLSGMLALTLAVLDHAESKLLEQQTFEDLMKVLKKMKKTLPPPAALSASMRRFLPQVSGAFTRLPSIESSESLRLPPLKRQGSQVVDQAGNQALSENNVGDTLDWIVNETSSALISWVETPASDAGGALFRWAFGECKAPALEGSSPAMVRNKVGSISF